MFVSVQRPDWGNLVYQSTMSLHVLCSLHTCCSPVHGLLLTACWFIWSESCFRFFPIELQIEGKEHVHYGWQAGWLNQGKGLSSDKQIDFFFFFLWFAKGECINNNKLGFQVFALLTILSNTNTITTSFLAVLLFLWSYSCFNISVRWVMRWWLSLLSWQVWDAFWKTGVLIQLLWLSVGIMLSIYISPECCAPCWHFSHKMLILGADRHLPHLTVYKLHV